MSIIRIGIDLAKNTFALCPVDEHKKIDQVKTLKRHELLNHFCNIPPCVAAMEAGSGAHPERVS
jgi:transposase